MVSAQRLSGLHTGSCLRSSDQPLQESRLSMCVGPHGELTLHYDDAGSLSHMRVGSLAVTSVHVAFCCSASGHRICCARLRKALLYDDTSDHLVD